jgi:methylenetetrahydrofolate reductase (NADPH)
VVLGRILRDFAQAGFGLMGAAFEQARGARDGDIYHRRVAELMRTSSIEISPRDDLAGEVLREVLDPGTTVFVNHPGSVTHHDIVAACARLQRAGFRPVPHVAARRLTSFTQANDFLRRAAAEADVRYALVIGGDPERPVGPFRDSLDLLATGVVERNGLERVAFAGYPEGHPRIASTTLDAALEAKAALASQRGLEVSLVTQFGFDAEPIQRWIASLRKRGFVSPVRIGLAGPASVATLAKFAFRCGIGASLRALARGHTAFARILVEAAPDSLVAALAAGEHPGASIDGLHIFTFGGVRHTAEWIRSLT